MDDYSLQVFKDEFELFEGDVTVMIDVVLHKDFLDVLLRDVMA